MGHWEWVEDEKWDTLPKKYYSLRRSTIYCRLYARLPDDEIHFCMDHDLMPEEGMKPGQLKRWFAAEFLRLTEARKAA